MQPDSSNIFFDMAVKYVNFTAEHLFVTGKAGTGKTTFLKYIKENSPKKLAILAPTGVAAINAAGSTIHSFFQLPFGSFIPGRSDLDAFANANFYNSQSLLSRLRLNKSKRRLLQELELLIIDEISMVRADLLDAVDTVLRSVRRQPQLAFGGVQMLYIGDLSQLPPVVKEQEWKTMSLYYQSPFFFHAHALRDHPPIYLELKKIYRQSDRIFINILNNIRNNMVRPEDIEFLNQYYRPDFKPETKGEYITLTSHNAKADIINQEELKKLSGKVFSFDAGIEGEFPENAYPAEVRLQLKEGAQIMFIRNDKGEARRFFNGKIGTINRINRSEIFVTFPDERGELLVEKEEWKNLRYHYNKEKDVVEEEEVGTFTQFPIRLAWAITIHKSQGLTFKKAIIDAGRSFAAGQVYVALSRLTSLEGLVLYSKIDTNCIITDKEADSFSNSKLEPESLHQQLLDCQKEYLHQKLVQAFSWHKLRETIDFFISELETRKIPHKYEAEALGRVVKAAIKEQRGTAEKFIPQLAQYLHISKHEGYGKVHERVNAASHYFINTLRTQCIEPVEKHKQLFTGKSKAKKYIKAVNDLLADFSLKNSQLEQAVKMTEGLVKGTDPSALLNFKPAPTANRSFSEEENPIKSKAKSGSKPVKGGSQRLSLQLFNEGKSIEEIAEERGFAVSTIEGHLLSFIPTGEIKLRDLVPENKAAMIEEAIDSLDSDQITSGMVKEIMSDEFSYGEIKAVLNHRKLMLKEDQK